MLGTTITVLDRVNTATTAWTGKLATVALMVMTAIVTIHVLTRYGFNYSFVWTEETARFLMVWMTFLFFPTGHKRGMNVAVEFLVSPWRSSKVGVLLRIVIEAALLFLLLVCLKLSFAMMGRGEHTMSQALQIPMIWIYAVMPVSFVLTGLCSLEALLRLVSELVHGAPQTQAAHDIEVEHSI